MTTLYILYKVSHTTKPISTPNKNHIIAPGTLDLGSAVFGLLPARFVDSPKISPYTSLLNVSGEVLASSCCIANAEYVIPLGGVLVYDPKP